jgi:hypothetical protein
MLHEEWSRRKLGSANRVSDGGAVPIVFQYLRAIQPVLDVSAMADDPHVVVFAGRL